MAPGFMKECLKMAKLVKGCIEPVAIAALSVVPAIALASPLLTDPTGTTVPPGASFTNNGEIVYFGSIGPTTVAANPASNGAP